MDIDDILREVDPASQSIPSETQDLQALTRAWVSERSSPELLHWPADGLFERVNDRIKQQIERVEEMTGDMDPKTNFALIVIQTELERFKYLVRSYLRARIAKIDKHTLHYLSNPELTARLSDTEQAYATRHQALLHNHYLSSFLSAFPPTLQNLNDTAGNISMIDTPDLDTAVFIRLLKDALVEGHGTDRDGATDGKNGDIIILRWSDAKPLVDSGRAEVDPSADTRPAGGTPRSKYSMDPSYRSRPIASLYPKELEHDSSVAVAGVTGCGSCSLTLIMMATVLDSALTRLIKVGVRDLPYSVGKVFDEDD